MKFLFLITILLIFHHFGKAKHFFNKCCEKDEVLLRVYDSKRHVCKVIKEVIPLVTSEDSLNSTLKNFGQNDLDKNGTKSCLDKTINGTVIELDENMEFLQEISVKTIYKCCPKGMVYNILNKNCQFSDIKNIPIAMSDEFCANFLTNFNFCPENNVVIDILTNLTEIDITLDFLKIHNSLTNNFENILVKNSCIDHVMDGRVVIRTCQSKNVCDKISCVRKCCENGRSYGNFDCVLNVKGIYNPEVFLEETNKEENWNGKGNIN